MFKPTINAVAIVVLALCHCVANAARIDEIPDGTSNTLLLAEYTQGVINFGPLSFGLSALPAKVNAQFRLGTVTVNPQPPGTPGTLNYGLADVMSAGVSFGDSTWTELVSFELEVEVANGNIGSLNYAFSPIASNTHAGGIVLNFPLSITGTDIVSGDEFSYTYSSSTQTIRNIPVPPILALFSIGIVGIGWSRRKTSAISS